MTKVTKLVLMLCLFLSGALCFAHGEAGTGEKGDGIPIGVIEASSLSGLDKGSAIVPLINAHVLSVVFHENLGQVQVEITTATGATVHCLSVLTPNGLQCYIPNQNSKRFKRNKTRKLLYGNKKCVLLRQTSKT